MYHGEKLNSISHLVGAVFALMALGALLTVAVQIGRPVVIAGFVTFGLSMVLLYSMSTLYHSFHHPGVKGVFKILDHVSIYLLIAGTYTPFMLITLGDGNGPVILAAVWLLAILGIASELFLSGKATKIGQIIIYLGMGWACTLDIDGLKQGLPTTGYNWLLTGGIAYTAGVVFYILDKLNWLRHAHGIWHFFVMVGSVAHFIAVIGYVR